MIGLELGGKVVTGFDGIVADVSWDTINNESGHAGVSLDLCSCDAYRE